jgi:two-component system cell cycle response regulator
LTLIGDLLTLCGAAVFSQESGLSSALDSEVKTRITPLSEVGQPEGMVDDCLVMIYSPDPHNLGKRQVLGNETLRIGRERGNQIVLPSDSVSRRHCRIDRRKAAWFIKDLGSTNGTYVNDELVEEYQLRRGDQVKVGDTIFKYLSGQDVEAQYHETIYRMTIMDGLTNVHNKRYLLETLERELPRATRHARPLTLCMFDLDHFKSVNDTFGHIAGDYVLKEVASAVRIRLRPDDILARYGGEEFAVLLPETDIQGAAIIAEELRKLIADRVFEFEGERIPVTISIGCNQLLAEHESDPVRLVKSADAKLYEAKRTGRNRVCA